MEITKPTVLRNTVDLSTDAMTRHWTNHLGATYEEIVAAIERVGDNVETVTKELQTLKQSKKTQFEVN